MSEQHRLAGQRLAESALARVSESRHISVLGTTWTEVNGGDAYTLSCVLSTGAIQVPFSEEELDDAVETGYERLFERRILDALRKPMVNRD